MNRYICIIFFSLSLFSIVPPNLLASTLEVENGSYGNLEERAFQEIDRILEKYSELLGPIDTEETFSTFCEENGMDIELLANEFSDDFSVFESRAISCEAPRLQNIDQDTYSILKREFLNIFSDYNIQSEKKRKELTEKKIPTETKMLESQLSGSIEMVYEPLRNLNKLQHWASNGNLEQNALIIYPTKDGNGVYDLNPSTKKHINTLKLFADLSEKYNVVFHRVQTIHQIKELIAKVRPEYLILGGHGTPQSICFDEGVYLRVSSDFSFLKNIPLKHIYLDSCSVGGQTIDDKNMVQIFARAVPYCKVIGPVLPHMDKYVAGFNQDMSVKLEKEEKSIAFKFAQ